MRIIIKKFRKKQKINNKLKNNLIKIIMNFIKNNHRKINSKKLNRKKIKYNLKTIHKSYKISSKNNLNNLKYKELKINHFQIPS